MSLNTTNEFCDTNENKYKFKDLSTNYINIIDKILIITSYILVLLIFCWWITWFVLTIYQEERICYKNKVIYNKKTILEKLKFHKNNLLKIYNLIHNYSIIEYINQDSINDLSDIEIMNLLDKYSKLYVDVYKYEIFLELSHKSLHYKVNILEIDYLSINNHICNLYQTFASIGYKDVARQLFLISLCKNQTKIMHIKNYLKTNYHY